MSRAQRVDNFIFNFCGNDPSPCARYGASDLVAGLETVFNRRGAFSIAAVNLSLGGAAFTSECSGSWYRPAIDNLRSAGIATVAAAGNEQFAGALAEPACVPGVISVGATDNNDVVPLFSNSATFLDFLAPGVSVTSSVPGGGFGMATGTSMAAPHVSGSFALLKQRFPNASVFALERALAQTALPVTDFATGITTPRIRVARALASPAVAHDFTRDRVADIGIWRPSTGEWWVLGQPTVQWGQPSDVPVAGDYDGDGTTERAIWRPSTGEWWIPGQPTVQWGTWGDVPVPADYDGNGTIDIAVWRPWTHEWWIRGQATVQWGQAGDVPIPRDIGNGRSELTVWRPGTGQWFTLIRLPWPIGNIALPVMQWGASGDRPL